MHNNAPNLSQVMASIMATAEALNRETAELVRENERLRAMPLSRPWVHFLAGGAVSLLLMLAFF